MKSVWFFLLFATKVSMGSNRNLSFAEFDCKRLLKIIKLLGEKRF
jgi:hypothetical protein